MKATKDNATYTEKIVLQDDGDSDFMKVTDTTVGFIPNEIPLLDTTTNTQIESFTEIAKDDEMLLVVDNNDTVLDITLNSVDTDTIDSTQTLDIFNDSSCVACYPFDSDANDLSGNYSGTWDGTEQYDTGKYGQAAKFDGDSYIDNTSINGMRSISFWFRIEDPSVVQYLCDFTNSKDNISLMIAIQDSKVLITNTISTSTKPLYTPNDGLVKPNIFYHLVVNVIDDDVFVYINNIISLQSGNSNNWTTVKGSGIKIGSDFNYGNNKLKGLIDQVRIFNRALTEDEITKLYNEQKTKYITDISSLNLSEAPSKAFFNQKPIVMIAIEDTQPDITDDSFSELTEKDLSYDGEKFTLTFDDMAKEGRAIQRKIVSPKEGMQILEPFTSNLYKKDS